MKRIFLLSIGLASVLTAQSRHFQFGVSAGIGMPKIPISQFRSPFSVIGSGMVHLSVYNKIGVQMDANALTTFSLGSVNNASRDLRFDVFWGSCALTYRLRGIMRNRSHLLLGVGRYFLTQEFNQGLEEAQTTGVNLGVSNWMAGRRLRSYLEVRWHLLFISGEDPQVLTVTYGILI